MDEEQEIIPDLPVESRKTPARLDRNLETAENGETVLDVARVDVARVGFAVEESDARAAPPARGAGGVR